MSAPTTDVPPAPPPPPSVGLAEAAKPGGKAFPTPQAAMEAVAKVAGLHDQAQIDDLFGPGATEVLWSGDDVADREGALRVKAMIESGVTF
jgi:hypothetical protein